MRKLLAVILLVVLFDGCKKDTTYIDPVPEFEIIYHESAFQLPNRFVSTSNGLAVVGTSISGIDKQLFLKEFNTAGDLMWTKLFEVGTLGYGIKCTSTGDLIVIGSFLNPTADTDVVLIKTNSLGQELWRNEFGGPSNDSGHDVIELDDNGFLILGTTQSYGGGHANMYVIRTDAEGNELWSRTFGGTALDGGSELVQENQDLIMLLGFSESFGSGNRDIYLQTISLDGDSLWSTNIGGSEYEESQAIARVPSGGYVLSSHSASEEPNHSLLATKLGMNGAIEWEHHFGTAQAHEGGEAVLSDSDGNYVFVGRTNSFGNDEQVYFIKTDSDGNVIEELNFGAEGDQRGNDIIEHNGSYYICGTSTENGDSDILLIKRPM